MPTQATAHVTWPWRAGSAASLAMLSGTLLDELILASVLAPLYSTDLRSPPLTELFAFDASDARAGWCRAIVSEDQWCSLYDLSEERVGHVRLACGSQPADPVFSDTRAAAAWAQGSQAHQPPRNRKRSVAPATSRCGRIPQFAGCMR